jgi:hypothetical protein
MGGIGSGNRSRYGGRATTDDMRSLDVRYWARNGLLRPGYRGSLRWQRRGETVATIGVRAEEGRVILTYRHSSRGSEWKNEEYPVYISRTRCRLAGTRPWFVCPAMGCRRRVALLYGDAIFACRHCHRLAYASTREEAGDRAARRADRIRERLGWEPGFLNGDGWKPKWMRWRTFSRLKQEHDRLTGQSMAAIAHKFRLTGEKPPF